MNAKSLIAAVIVCVGSMHADAGSADRELQQSLDAYRGAASRGQWHSSWLPTADANAPVPTVSADRMLTRIVAAQTREILDRRGWENPYLTNSNYASGNTLLAVEVGNGITTPSVGTPVREFAKVADLGAR